MTVTAAQIAGALAGTSQARAVDLRFEHRTRGGLLLGDITHAFLPDTYRDQCDNANAVTMTGNVTARADLLPADLQEIGVVAEVLVRPLHQAEPEQVDFPLSLYRPALGLERTTSDGKPTVDIRLHSQESYLVSETLDDAETIPAGTGYLTELGATLAARDMRHAIPASPGRVTPLSYDLGPGTSIADKQRWLAHGLNYHAPWPDGSGIFRTRERTDPATVPSAVHYSDTTEGVRMIDDSAAYERPRDLIQRKNVCVAKNEDPRRWQDGALEDFGLVAYRNADPTSPISTANQVTDERTLTYDTEPSTRFVLDTATQRDLARYELRAEATLASQATLHTFADWRRGPHEYITVTYSGAEQAQKFRVLSWERDYATGRMTHRLARVLPVALTEVA